MLEKWEIGVGKVGAWCWKNGSLVLEKWEICVWKNGRLVLKKWEIGIEKEGYFFIGRGGVIFDFLFCNEDVEINKSHMPVCVFKVTM